MKEGTQASVEQSVFTAEAGDYNRIQHIQYGPEILELDTSGNNKEWWY